MYHTHIGMVRNKEHTFISRSMRYIETDIISAGVAERNRGYWMTVRWTVRPRGDRARRRDQAPALHAINKNRCSNLRVARRTTNGRPYIPPSPWRRFHRGAISHDLSYFTHQRWISLWHIAPLLAHTYHLSAARTSSSSLDLILPRRILLRRYSRHYAP